MTKADIVNSVSSATGLTKVETEAVLEGVIQSISSSLKKTLMKNKRQVKELVVLALTKITKNYCAFIALYAIILYRNFYFMLMVYKLLY